MISILIDSVRVLDHHSGLMCPANDESLSCLGLKLTSHGIQDSFRDETIC